MDHDPGDTIITTAERLRKEGEARGEAQGRRQQAIETMLRLLDRRFGPLPADVVCRVQNGTLPDLDQWIANTLDAKTLAGVFQQG